MALDVLKGLTPLRKVGSNYNGAGFNTYPITNGYAVAIGEGDPVKMSAGAINIAVNTSPVIGVFGGVTYIDSEGQLQFKKSFVAATSSKGGIKFQGGYSQPLAMIYDDPNQTYVARTHLSALAATQIGTSFKMSAIGSIVNERSQAVLDVNASVGTSGGHMVTVLGLYTGRDSAWGTGPIAVEVKLSNHGIIGEL